MPQTPWREAIADLIPPPPAITVSRFTETAEIRTWLRSYTMVGGHTELCKGLMRPRLEERVVFRKIDICHILKRRLTLAFNFNLVF